MSKLRGVRVPLVLVVAASVLAIGLPGTATASFDPEFSVLSKDNRGHETPDGFILHTFLLNPDNLDQRVGKSKIKFRFSEGDRKVHARGVFHFDGTIGGFGDLVLKGNIGHADTTLSVVDGTGDFSGAVTGKAVVHDVDEPKNLIDFHLTR